MITLQITNNSPEAMRFLEYARTFPFVKEKEEKLSLSIPHSREELRDAVQRAEKEVGSGLTYTIEQVREKFMQI